jgi:hypothetical protein
MTAPAVGRRNLFRVHINTVMKIPDPQKTGNFLFLEQLSNF